MPERVEHLGGTRQRQCEVVVVGAGMSGLVAATTLAPTTDVVVLEGAGRPGGRVESVRDGDYWLNVGTQFAEGTGILFDLMDRHGVERVSLADKRTAMSLQDRWVPMDDPVRLVLRSRLPWRARVDLARLGLRVRRAHKRLTSNRRPDDARAYRAELDTQSGDVLVAGIRSPEILHLFSDLSGQWIGCEPSETAATQLVFSIGTALEKTSEVPNFSLPVGGNETLVDALAADLGDRLCLSSPVESIRWTEGQVTVCYSDAQGPVELTAARAIVAVPADRALDLLGDLPDEHRSAFEAIGYGRYVIVGVFTSEEGKQRWDDHYAIATPDKSFQMVFNHASALRGEGARRPGGALVCLSGGARADDHLGLTDDEITALYVGDLLRMFPELEGHIERVVVRRHHKVVPFWGPGDRASVRVLREALGPIHFAGDYLIGVPSLADAAASGQRAAEQVLALR